MPRRRHARGRTRKSLTLLLPAADGAADCSAASVRGVRGSPLPRTWAVAWPYVVSQMRTSPRTSRPTRQPSLSGGPSIPSMVCIVALASVSATVVLSLFYELSVTQQRLASLEAFSSVRCINFFGGGMQRHGLLTLAVPLSPRSQRSPPRVALWKHSTTLTRYSATQQTRMLF